MPRTLPPANGSSTWPPGAPKADHDDGPDMVQMLYMLCVTGGIAMAQGGNTSEPQTARERYARTAARMNRKRTS